MSNYERAPFPGQRGSRTGGILRSKLFWAAMGGGLFVTGGLMRIGGVSAREVLFMGGQAAENNSDAAGQLRDIAANGIATGEVNPEDLEISSTEEIDIAAALEGAEGVSAPTTEAVSGLGATALTVNPENDTLYSVAQACGLDVTGDDQAGKIEIAAQDLAAVNEQFVYSGQGSWQEWNFAGDIACPQQ